MVELLLAIGVALVAAAAEWWHVRRCRRVPRLLYGSAARPRAWVRLVAPLRVAAAGALAWGLLVLWQLDPAAPSLDPRATPTNHLLVCLDVSPSMYLRDAGPDRDQSRAERAAVLLETILARLDTERTRVSVVAFYTSAKPVVLDAFDMNVVSNVLNGLPLEHAFEVGSTMLQEGVEESFRFARAWPADSAALIVVSDGDTISQDLPAGMPSSIADVLVIGVGDPHRGAPIAGRTSRQDHRSLKRLAVRLDGMYHDGNTQHLPSEVIRGLSMTIPELRDDRDRRRYGLIASAAGAGTLALLPLMLALAGAPLPQEAGAARANSSAVAAAPN